MKEFTIEQKAKAYDEAIERARDVYTYYCDDREQLKKIEYIFPELAESEDERIRSLLISSVKNEAPIANERNKELAIAWLEEQGQHKKFRDSIQVGDKVTRNENGVLVNLSQLNRVAKKDKKQDEQKHKIQPKFKIGDIIRFKGNETLTEEAETHKIVSYDNELYVFADGTTDLFCEQDLYELVEQKPADEVGNYDHKKVLQAIINEQKPLWSEEDDKMYNSLTEFEKAVKQVMEEAIECGDTHNLKADADMLLRLTQKPAWSEEDEKMIRGLIVICDEWTTRHSFYPIENCEIEKLKNWLEFLKERMKGE